MKKLLATGLIALSLLSPLCAMDGGQAAVDPVQNLRTNAKQLKNDILRKYPSIGKVLIAATVVGTGYGVYQSAGAFVGTDLYKFLLINFPLLRWVNLELWNFIHDNCYSVADWLYLQRIIFS